MNIVKRPRPRNFNSGNVCISQAQAKALQPGDMLTLLSFDEGTFMNKREITQAMIDTLEDQGTYFLMTYKE